VFTRSDLRFLPRGGTLSIAPTAGRVNLSTSPSEGAGQRRHPGQASRPRTPV